MDNVCWQLNGFTVAIHVRLMILWILVMSGGVVFTAQAQELPTRGKGSITVMADASLTVPLTLIAREFSREKHMPVSVEFASTKDQIEKIEQGAEANVLISAKPLWIKRMQQGGLIDVYSRTNIAENRLVVVGALGAQSLQADVTGDKLLKLFPRNKPEFQFAMGDPEYLAEGTYTLESLGMLGLEGDLESHFAIFRSISEMAKVVANTQGVYGVMYASDLLVYPRMSRIAQLPDGSHNPIVYQAVVVAGEYMDEAREFLKYVQQAHAQKYFEQAGMMAAR